MSVPELSVQIRNTPGQLVQITTILAEAGVDIFGLTASSAGRTGWVRLVVDQTKVAEEALEDCGISAEVGEALAILLDHESGSLDRALRILADEGISVDYIYTCVERRNNRVLVIVGVQSPSKAEKLLKKLDVEIADLPLV